MAPRRGGGGGRGGSISTCPDAFTTTLSQVAFAGNVIWFVAYLGLSFSLCAFRKKNGAGKKLLGLPYALALSCLVIAYGCVMIRVILYECDVNDSGEYLNWQYPITIFSYLGDFLLLVVFVWTLNSMLRAQFNPMAGIFKVAFIAILAFIGLLTCAVIAVICYINSTQLTYPRASYEIILASWRLQVAYHSLFLLVVLASGAFSIMTIMSLRSRKNSAGDLVGWVSALTLSMTLWNIIEIVWPAYILSSRLMERETSIALSWVYNFAQVLSFMFILCIAKHMCWNRTAVENNLTGPDEYAGVAPPPQQQYAYNANTNNQAYYYQQPVHNGNGAVNVKA